MSNFDSYQQQATWTAIYPGRGTLLGLTYCALKLNGEAGEVAELVGKAHRDDSGQLTEERREKLLLELGDVLWYVASLASELGFTLNHVADTNLEKLASRKARGTLHGEGSSR